MIPFKNRFHGHKSLKYTYRNGEIVRNKLFTIKFTKNPKRRFSRISIVVSKKIAKSAVKRNLIRRRFFNLIYHKITKFNDIYDVIIIVHSIEVMDMNFDNLEKKLIQEFINAQIMV